jgi:hypothetical protein
MIRIAAVSEDGVTISQHFDRAPIYVVVRVEDGRIVARETRDKLGHAQFAAEGHEVPPEAARSCSPGEWALVPSRACSRRASSPS